MASIPRKVVTHEDEVVEQLQSCSLSKWYQYDVQQANKLHHEIPDKEWVDAACRLADKLISDVLLKSVDDVKGK